MARQPAPEAHYVSQFERTEQNGAASSPAWLRGLRQEAIADFARLGFPVARRGNELWKYTDIRPIAEAQFPMAADRLDPGSLDVVGARFHDFDLPCPRVHQLVFIDGHYAPGLSTEPPSEAGMAAETIGHYGKGLEVRRLADGIDRGLGPLREHLGRHAEYGANAFAALNTAFIDDGAFVYIPEGAFVPEPIYLLFISTADGARRVTHPRVLIVAGPGSRATVLESFESLHGGADEPDQPAPGPYFTNAVTEVVTLEDADLRLCRIQREAEYGFHVATTQMSLGRNSRVSATTLDAGSAIGRHDQRVLLAEGGARIELNGLYVGRGKRHIDNHTYIDHAVPDTSSREVFKGILDGESHGVFVGHVLVRPDAQRSDAQQVNKNLLLSGAAEIDTQPKLEIFADDVKCTHGAAVGRLDPQSLYYVKSRGLGEREARQLLVHGFINEVVGAIADDAVRQFADGVIAGQIDD